MTKLILRFSGVFLFVFLVIAFWGDFKTTKSLVLFSILFLIVFYFGVEFVSRNMLPSIQINHNIRIIKNAPEGYQIYLGKNPGVIANYADKVSLDHVKIYTVYDGGVFMKKII